MEEKKKENNEPQLKLPIYMVKFSSYALYQSTLPPLITSTDKLMENLNLTGMGLTMCKPNPNLFSVPTRAPYSDFKCPRTWEPILDTEEARAERSRVYDKLRQKVYQGETIFPKEELTHRAFEECPLDKLKVVLVAQDPYHKIHNVLGVEIANGLAFSGLYGGEKPNSMNKISTELRRTFPGIALEHWDLTSWARQGVLLLNTSLTVRMGEANSHGKEKLWKYYIEYVLKRISDSCPHVIFVLWGAHAKELAERTVDPPISPRSKILKCGHPSGINSSKNKESMFDENGHFSAIYYDIYNQNMEIYKKNQTLSQSCQPLLPYVDQIDWSLKKEDYEKIRHEDKWRREQEAIKLAQSVSEEKYELPDDESTENISQQQNLSIQQSNPETEKISINMPMIEYTQEQIQQLLSQGYTREQIQQYQQYYVQQYYEKLYMEEYQRKQNEYNYMLTQQTFQQQNVAI